MAHDLLKKAVTLLCWNRMNWFESSWSFKDDLLKAIKAATRFL